MNPEDKMIDGIQFHITRKKMKNLRMRLMPDNSVAVSVPETVTKSQLEDFLKKGVVWAKDAIAKKSTDPDVQSVNNNEPLQFFYHLGKKIAVKYVESNENRVVIEGDILYVKSEKIPPRDAVTEAIKKLQRSLFNHILPDLTAECERMAHAVPNEWRIRDMRTKWGTCNVTDKRIWLRLELISYPIDCIKAVMIHELTHLHEKGHTKRFYALMNEFYPENAEPNDVLKKNMYDWW